MSQFISHKKLTLLISTVEHLLDPGNPLEFHKRGESITPSKSSCGSFVSPHQACHVGLLKGNLLTGGQICCTELVLKGPGCMHGATYNTLGLKQ